MPELTEKGKRFKDGGLLWGATNSGKTFPAAYHFTRYCAKVPGIHILMGSKLKLLRTEVIPLIRAIARSYRCRTTPYSTQKGTFNIGKSVVFVVCGTNDGDEERIRTIHNAESLYSDEVAAQKDTFFDMGISRKRIDGPVWATCNPSTPINWVKQRLDNGDWDYDECFRVADNPSLTPEQVAKFEAQFVGLFKKRMIDALWVAGEGLIYPNWTDLSRLDLDDPDDLKLSELKTAGGVYLGVDYGSHNVTTALIAQRANTGQFVIMDQYHHDAYRSGVQKDPKHHARDIKTVASKYGPVINSFIDPSAVDLKRAFDDVGMPQQNAYNQEDGYNICDGMLQRKELLIMGANCVPLVAENYGLIWNRYGDKPDPKCVDHSTDAERYLACGVYEGHAVTAGRHYG